VAAVVVEVVVGLAGMGEQVLDEDIQKLGREHLQILKAGTGTEPSGHLLHPFALRIEVENGQATQLYVWVKNYLVVSIDVVEP